MVQLYYDKYIAKPLRLPTVSETSTMLRKPPPGSLLNGFKRLKRLKSFRFRGSR